MQYVLRTPDRVQQVKPLVLVQDETGRVIYGAELTFFQSSPMADDDGVAGLVRYVEALLRNQQLDQFPPYSQLLQVTESDLAPAVPTKQCGWQRGEARTLLCSAASTHDSDVIFSEGPLRYAPTGRQMCNDCDLPDESILCSNFSHPEVVALSPTGRELDGFICQAGKSDEYTTGADCRAGRLKCWEMSVTLARRTTALSYPPIVLPEAFDQLDAAWRLRHDKDKHLFRYESAAVVAGLMQDAADGDEFKTRLDDLADTIDRIEIHDELIEGLRVDPGSLNRLQAWSNAQLDGSALDRVLAGISVLRSVRNARRSYAHANRRAELLTHLVLLGVEYPINDYSAAWTSVRSATIDALREIRRGVAQSDLGGNDQTVATSRSRQ